MDINKVRKNFLSKEKYLQPFATKSEEAIRLKKIVEDMRPPYFRDSDKIIHSFSYTRYADKTQVYSYKDNGNISKRMTHVQLVSKIARTIGRALKLNDDLIEAIALGHDIGHSPLGHVGEQILDEISMNALNERFAHNIQSVRYYMNVDNGGKGLNLTVQTLDGIMCHNGEILSPVYKPMKKSKKEFLRQYEESYYDLDASRKYAPMTIEGCVVRISDVVGYIGRDIEDAIDLGLFQREDIPKEITDVLGNTNKEIVNTIILDIIDNSMDKPYIKMSKDVYEAVFALKRFNKKNIYLKSMTTEEYNYYKKGMTNLYKKYYNDLLEENMRSLIYRIFLAHQSDEYIESTKKERIVIDFISGMTDEYFLNQIKSIDIAWFQFYNVL